jgi:hypothetical protein
VHQFRAVAQPRSRDGDGGDSFRAKYGLRQQGQAVAGGGQPDEGQRVVPGVPKGRPEAFRAGVPTDLRQRRGHLVRRYPPGIGQVLEAQGGAGRQRVADREHDADRGLAEAYGRDRSHLGKRVAGRRQAVGQAQVQFAARDPGGNPGAGGSLDGDVQTGLQLTQLG